MLTPPANPPHWDLPLERGPEPGGKLVEISRGNVREVDPDEQVEELCRLRQLIERVKPRLPGLVIEKLDKRVRKIPHRFVRLRFLPERERSQLFHRQEVEIDIRGAETSHRAEQLSSLFALPESLTEVVDGVLGPDQCSESLAFRELGDETREADRLFWTRKALGWFERAAARVRKSLIEYDPRLIAQRPSGLLDQLQGRLLISEKHLEAWIPLRSLREVFEGCCQVNESGTYEGRLIRDQAAVTAVHTVNARARNIR